MSELTILKEPIKTYDEYGKWISCSERLPKESEQDDELGVLVTLGNGYNGIQFDWVHNGHWYDWDGYVIAWMPLPEPYTADRKTESNSEKPNNSTISKMEQVEDEPQTDNLATAIANEAYCRTCKHLLDEDCDCDIVFTGYEPKESE